MKRTKKEKGTQSLQFKIAKYLSIFAFFSIALVFLFQIVLLEPMYENSKKDQVVAVADHISTVLDSEYLTDYIYNVQAQTDTCVMVYHADTGGWNYDTSNNMGCLLYRLSPSSIGTLIKEAANSSDGTYLVKQYSKSVDFAESEDSFRNLIYTKVVKGENSDSVVMVSSGISPINATLTTLKVQIMWIAFVMFVSAIILAMILYRQIAKPLSLITDSAKDLPKGEYTIKEETNVYEEAVILNSTLKQAAEDIQKADKAKRDLISNVSHDLRTPLTMISGYGEMMMDLPEEKTDENIRVIVEESRRLNALVNDLLDLSKLQDSRIILQLADFNLSEMIREQMKKYEVYSYREGFRIEQQIPDEIMICADEKRLEQVFNNFMTNAINYSGERRHIIVREEQKDDLVYVYVQDFGEGIPEEKLGDIWERYYKIDKEHVRVSNGSGLGLSICHEILELHKAKYGVESVQGEGSTFWFAFPVSKAAQ